MKLPRGHKFDIFYILTSDREDSNDENKIEYPQILEKSGMGIRELSVTKLKGKEEKKQNCNWLLHSGINKWSSEVHGNFVDCIFAFLGKSRHKQPKEFLDLKTIYNGSSVM